MAIDWTEIEQRMNEDFCEWRGQLACLVEDLTVQDFILLRHRLLLTALECLDEYLQKNLRP